MKKHILTAAMATMMCVAMSAETFSPGGKWEASYDEAVTGMGTSLPYQLDEPKSSSQIFLPASLLGELAPKADANGKTVAKIKSINVQFCAQDVYGDMEGEGDFEVWIENTSATDFPMEANVRQWFEYSNGTHGQLKVDASDLGITYYEPFTLSIPFDESFVYEGEGIILTFKGTCDFTESYGMDWYGGVFTYSPRLGVLSGMATDHKMSGKLTNTQSVIPYMQFVYEKETEEFVTPGPTVEAATFNLGGKWEASYDDAVTGMGTNLPYQLDEPKSSSQVFLPASMLAELAPKTDATGKTVSKINTISVQFCAQDIYSDMSGEGDFEVWIENTSATDFPMEANVRQWFDYSNATHGQLKIDASEIDFEYYEPFTLTIPLDESFEYLGEGLVLTFKGSCDFTDEYGMDWYGGAFTFSPKLGVLSGMALDHKMSGKLTNTQSVVPYMQLGYDKVTEAVTTQVAVIENAVASVKPSADGSVNLLTLDFDINDPAASGKYEVKLGATSLGTVEGTHVTISYLENFDKDQIVSIVPAADGVIGTTYTLAAGTYDGYFKDFHMQAVKSRGYAEFKASEPGSKTVGAALQVEYVIDDVENAAPVIKMKVTGSSAYKNTVPDMLAEEFAVADAGAFDNFAANKGLRTFYRDNFWQGVKYLHGELGQLSGGSFDIEYSVVYPMAYSTVPVLNGAVAANATVLEIKAKNTDPYGKPAVDPSQDNFVVLNLTYPDNRIESVDEGDGYVLFVAPAGHNLWHSFMPSNGAMVATYSADSFMYDGMEYTSSNGCIYSHNANEQKNGRLYLIATIDNEAGEPEIMHATSYAFDENGTISGVESVALDAAGQSVEYYNLQGVRVAKPTAGGIYIRRQGTSVSKVAVN